MLRFLLPREADRLLRIVFKDKETPDPEFSPVTESGLNTLALPPATIEDALVKKIATVFELGKQSLPKHRPAKSHRGHNGELEKTPDS